MGSYLRDETEPIWQADKCYNNATRSKGEGFDFRYCYLCHVDLITVRTLAIYNTTLYTQHNTNRIHGKRNTRQDSPDPVNTVPHTPV